MVVVLAALVGAGACAVVFLESGANSGEVELELAEAYAPGSAEFIGDRNFFLVRTPDGAFFALLDMDAANRAEQGRRCRAQLIPRGDAEVAVIQSRFQSQFSPQAAGVPIVFREECNGALYDATGGRLDSDGKRNLDRYPVQVNDKGRVEVSAGARVCTGRIGDELFAEVDC